MCYHEPIRPMLAGALGAAAFFLWLAKRNRRARRG